MTGNLIFDLAISLAGIIAIVALSAVLGGVRDVRLDAARAGALARVDEPDFEPGLWRVGEDGRAGYALGADGADILFVFVYGDRLALRRLPRRAVTALQDETRVTIELGEPSVKRIAMTAPDAETARLWLGELAGRP